MGILTVKEEIILLALCKLGGRSHGVLIRDTVIDMTRSPIVYGTLYNSLEYLIRKGYVISKKGSPTPERGGKSKTIYQITPSGLKALQETKSLHENIWKGIPDLDGMGSIE